MESQLVKGKNIVEGITEKITLSIFNLGSDRTNYEILKLLPTTTKELEKKLNLTKMPTNRRLNELEKVGLVKRDKYGGKIESTELTKMYIKLIEELKEKVIKNLPNFFF